MRRASPCARDTTCHVFSSIMRSCKVALTLNSIDLPSIVCYHGAVQLVPAIGHRVAHVLVCVTDCL